MHYITSYVVVGVKYELKTPVCLCEALSRISFLQCFSWGISVQYFQYICTQSQWLRMILFSLLIVIMCFLYLCNINHWWILNVCPRIQRICDMDGLTKLDVLDLHSNQVHIQISYMILFLLDTESWSWCKLFDLSRLCSVLVSSISSQFLPFLNLLVLFALWLWRRMLIGWLAVSSCCA